MERRKEKLTRRQRRIKNRVTIRTLFLVAITLIFNTYAWFLYVNTVSGDLTAHVDAWQVAFEVDEEIVQEEFVFDIAHAYPGMSNASKTVTIVNQGERTAQIDYEIKSARILDDVYISTEAAASGTTVPTGATTMSAAALLTKLQTDYPFNISFTGGGSTVATNGGTGALTITFSWAYESGNDVLDTSYGTGSYDYYQSNSGEPAIEIIIKIIAKQAPNS